MAQGTEFVQDIYVMDSATEFEKGALYSALYEWFKVPKIGGMSAKGFGFFDAVSDIGINVENGAVTVPDNIMSLIDGYLAFVKMCGNDALHLLESGKNGKK
jgi:hypothetical protein